MEEKKILLITPNFFDYPKFICEELQDMGYEVDWYDDRPSTNAFVKAIIRINRKLIVPFIKRYFKKIIKKTADKRYLKVIIISGQSFSFSESMLAELKDQQSQAEWILYQWDSLKNFPYIERMQKYFDRCYSFDMEDVKNNSSLLFLPLFYAEKYYQVGQSKKDTYKYDFMFIGTAHPKKYKFVTEIQDKLKDIYKNGFVYFFLPSKIVYYYRKLRDKEYKHAKISEFNFVSLKGKQIDEIYEDSMCVLDSAQANQTGLTIRVLETLGAKKKLITTNNDVVNYDFYRPENIYVYNGRIDKDDIFFNSSYVDIDEKIYKKYSLQNWLSELLGDGVNA